MPISQYEELKARLAARLEGLPPSDRREAGVVYLRGLEEAQNYGRAQTMMALGATVEEDEKDEGVYIITSPAGTITLVDTTGDTVVDRSVYIAQDAFGKERVEIATPSFYWRYVQRRNEARQKAGKKVYTVRYSKHQLCLLEHQGKKISPPEFFESYVAQGRGKELLDQLLVETGAEFDAVKGAVNGEMDKLVETLSGLWASVKRGAKPETLIVKGLDILAQFVEA